MCNPRRRRDSRHHASGCRDHQPGLPVRVGAGADPGGAAAGRGAEAGRGEARAVRDWPRMGSLFSVLPTRAEKHSEIYTILCVHVSLKHH